MISNVLFHIVIFYIESNVLQNYSYNIRVLITRTKGGSRTKIVAMGTKWTHSKIACYTLKCNMTPQRWNCVQCIAHDPPAQHLTYLFWKWNYPFHCSKNLLVNSKLMHILRDQSHKAIALFILLYISFGSPNLFSIIPLNKLYNKCNEKSINKNSHEGVYLHI